MTELKPGQLIPEIYREHLREASYVWTERNLAAVSSQFRLPELAELDNRLEAHVHGLLLGGDEGCELAKEELDPAVAEEAWSQLIALSSCSNLRPIAEVVEANANCLESVEWVGAALAWIPRTSEAHRRLIQALGELKQHPVARAALLREAARTRLLDEVAVVDATASEHAVVRCVAFQEVGRLRLRSSVANVTHSLRDPIAAVRAAAARAALLIQHPEGLDALRSIAEQEEPDVSASMAAGMWGSFAPVADVIYWNRMMGRKSATFAARAITALGATGAPAAGDLLVEYLDDPRLEPIAADALVLMTGIELDADGLLGGPPVDESDDDPELPQEHPDWYQMPRVDVRKLAECWRQRRAQFDDGRRFLAGGRIDDAAHARHVLREGNQKQRRAAAHILALNHQSPGPVFDIQATTRSQLFELAQHL